MTLTFQHQRAQQGHCDWDECHPPTKIVIKVDANQQTGEIDHIGTVVHELLHVILYPMVLGWLTDEMEEVVILAFDAVVVKYIRKSPTRIAAWTEAINTKLKEVES